MAKMFSLRNLGIRGLIGLTLGVMLAVILGLSAVAYFGLKTAADGYEYMLNDVAVVSDTVDRIESGFTNAELALLQYSLLKEEARGAQAVAVLQKVRDEIGFLERYIRDSGLGSTEIIGELQTLTTLYRVDVSSYLDTTSALGIDTYSGIQGTHWAEGNMLHRTILESGDEFIKNRFSELRRNESEFMRNGTEEAAGSVADFRDAILDYLAALAPTEDRRRMQDLLVSYMDDFDTMRRNKIDSDGMLLELTQSSAQIAQNLGRIASEMDVVVNDVANSVRSRTILIEAIMGLVVAVSFTLAILVGINLFRRIGRPMGAILKVTDAMANGRLDQRAGLTRNDEMGHIASNIDRAGETLAEIIRTIQGTVSEGTALSDRLGTVAEQTAAAFTQVSANISSIDASTDVMDRAARAADAEVADIVENLHGLNELASDQSASVEESTASVEEMVASISNVNDIAEEKARVAGQLADQAAESRESVRRTGRLVEEINGLTEGIGSVIGMINSVASRTNLLAMNAAIEAAHAGDAGRGFAVVADEVRKLAETTGSNAKSISDSLGVLVDRVAQVQEAAAVSRKTIDHMTEEAQGFTQSFSEIASSMNEMNLGSREVLGSTQSLAEKTRELNDSIERMRLQAESAGKGVRSMRNMAGQVSDGVGEIGRASVEIHSSAEELTKDGNGNRALMQRLFGLSERFVVQDRVSSEIVSAQA